MTKRKVSPEKEYTANKEDSILSSKRSKTSKAGSAPPKRVTNKIEGKKKKTDLRALLLDLAQAPLDVVITVSLQKSDLHS